jgi:hypothetical protein
MPADESHISRQHAHDSLGEVVVANEEFGETSGVENVQLYRCEALCGLGPWIVVDEAANPETIPRAKEYKNALSTVGLAG